MEGIAGLDIEPTSHHLDLAGRHRYTWCALDAVGIFSALKATGSVTSAVPGGDEIRVDFVDGVPADGDIVLFLADGFGEGSINETRCPKVNFFPDVAAAEAWAISAGVAGETVSLAEVTPMAGEHWREVAR